MSKRTDKKSLGIKAVRGGKLLILTCITLVLASSGSNFVMADENDYSGTNAPAIDVPETDKDQVEADFLKQIQRELNLSKADYKQLLVKVADTRARLQEVTEEKLTLQEQLNNLDDQINATTGRLLKVLKKVAGKENLIKKLYEEIEMREVALAYQKELLMDYVQLMYQEENALLAMNLDGSIDAFKMLIADGSVGENLRQMNYLSLLGQAGAKIIEKMDAIFADLQNQRDLAGTEKEKLDVLRLKIQEEKDQLELQKESKKSLLKITKGQEKIYSQLLDQTIEEEEEMFDEVRNLNIAVKFIQAKVAEEGANFDPSKYDDVLDERTKVLYEFYANNPDAVAGELVWPVEPKLGISAYFKDPSYVGVFGVQHKAIDIPAYQGTAVRAAEDAVVYSAKDNGYGYSYIILSHAGGLMTVYGHVSKILVEEGQKVPQGFVIALSGGMPGTKGAGYMTTGAHLHFETLLNGQHKDPLDYLSLFKLPEESLENLPEKYKARVRLLDRY
ncbi:peptidoglycan DD-metalloendopeptidase family protein [Candidatus Peregrinibacteria bacterium]|nr:peptidoglycan DD-metalloendopeptidase family protein [Candidatus Peregrinibacteria bacterium]